MVRVTQLVTERVVIDDKMIVEFQGITVYKYLYNIIPKRTTIKEVLRILWVTLRRVSYINCQFTVGLNSNVYLLRLLKTLTTTLATESPYPCTLRQEPR